MKKSENFSKKIMIFQKISKIFENLDFFQYDFQLIFSKKIEIFPIFEKDLKNFENVLYFFDFLNEIFMNFKKT